MAIFDLGPFRLYRVEKNKTLCVSLKCLDDWSFGWEYGWNDPARGVTTPFIEFRLGKLMVLYLEFWKYGCELWFLGFWMIFSWEKEKK